MKGKIGKHIYFFIAIIIFIVGVVVKYFFVDTDLGARFKNFNQSLLASDIIFLFALAHGVIGLIFYGIKKSRRTKLKDSVIITSAILIMPITIVFAITPILETIYPGKVGDNIFASIIVYFTIIGTFAAFAWIILIVVILITQTFFILKYKDKLE